MFGMPFFEQPFVLMSVPIGELFDSLGFAFLTGTGSYLVFQLLKCSFSLVGFKGNRFHYWKYVICLRVLFTLLVLKGIDFNMVFFFSSGG